MSDSKAFYRSSGSQNPHKHHSNRFPRSSCLPLLYWLDLGNNASSGQFILGQPRNSSNTKKKDRLPTVAELYPEILKSDEKEDDQPSCSAAEALTRQEPFINQNLAYQALAMLTQLLRHGSVSYQGGFCNLTTGRLVPLPIPAARSNSAPRGDYRTKILAQMVARKQQKRAAQGMVLEAILARRGPQREPEAMKQ
jgi:hypothetical protein